MSCLTQFWSCFKEQDFEKAQLYFDQLTVQAKQQVLSDLFQRNCHSKKPLAISVLRRELWTGQSFSDFYQAWLPAQNTCRPVDKGEQTFQQHFPVPVRVINATNISRNQEILSVSLVWAESEKQQQQFWSYVNTLMAGQDLANQQRHDSIQQTAEGELVGIYRVERDDNLGSPFGDFNHS